MGAMSDVIPLSELPRVTLEAYAAKLAARLAVMEARGDEASIDEETLVAARDDEVIEACARAAEACDTAKHTGAPCSSCAGAAARIRAIVAAKQGEPR
jgi:hypothetical protein